MPISYHRFAGSSLDRLAALSDGVFAVAMTLLVLDLKPPSVPKRAQQPIWSGGGGSEHVLLHGLANDVAPRLLPYAMSFLTLGIFWVGQQSQLESFTRSTRALTWIHLTFLLGVTLMPFSTGLLAQDITFRLSMAVYWLNLFLLGAVLFVSLMYAERAGLLSADTTPDMRRAMRRRIVIYQCLYAVAALTCLINTYLAIGLLIALQLNSVISPRIWFLDRA
ncbi:MAG: TMEM175 family protein [Solirubrobacteraceae bacterium]